MSVFQFKYFNVTHSQSSMKVGTDAMVLGASVDTKHKISALDIGAGTGVISLMIAQQNPKLQVTAIEIDQQAAEECADNFTQSPWNDRLTTIQSDFLAFASDTTYDLIVSNPPYYTSTLENSDERKAKSRHISALPMDDFLSKSKELLAKDGDLWIIVPFLDHKNWVDSALRSQLYLKESIVLRGKVELPPNRAILHFSDKEMVQTMQDLVIRNSDGTYTEEYRALTLEFHGKKI